MAIAVEKAQRPPAAADAPDAGGDTAAEQEEPRRSDAGRAGAAHPLLRWGSRYVLLVLMFVVWEGISRSSPDMSLLLPAPTEVVKAGYELFQQGSLQRDILASLKRVGVALGFASLIGFPLGAALGASRRFAWAFEPVVNFFRPIPPLAWIPLSIVWFGISDAQNQFIIFLAAFFPIVLSTMEGVRDVDRQLIRASRTLGAGRVAIALTVVLPGALPSMFVGLRVGIGIAWMALVAGELVAATSGLGFLISQGRLLFRSDYIVVGMVMIGLIGLMLDALARLAQHLVMPWREEN
ncbi:MAG TPA: ABC transporter permease [Pelomicrobium sp.]|nr:ABC transporter permease [Pelomicrobium sp.]